MINKALIISMLTFVSFPNYSQQTPKNAGLILDAMSKKYSASPNFKAIFNYSTEGTKDIYKGDVTVKGTKYILKLAGQELYNNGKIISTYIKETNEVNISNFDPAENDINPAQIYTIYKKGYKYTLLPQKKVGSIVYDVVELTPEKASSQISKLQITVANKDKSVKGWKIINKDGKKQNFIIEKFVPLKVIPDAYFTFDKSKYPGVEVVDLR